MKPRAVILAAGQSRRMGLEKMLLEIDGEPMLQRVLRAANEWDPLVVTSAEIAALPWVREGAAQIVVNQWPDLGISYSLSLAHVATPATQPMLLLFGDMPYVTPGLIAEVVERSGTADICRPVRNGVPGHPVYFSPLARIGIALLRARDSLHEVCHDPALQRIEFECGDDGAFTDIDTPSDLPA